MKKARAGRPPRGEGAKTSARIDQVQRARLMAAMGQAALEQGAPRATVSAVIAHASVSRRTFYEHFANTEECLLATLEDAVAVARAAVREACTQARPIWREQVWAGLAALLALFEERPQLAHLLAVDWPLSGAKALRRREEVLGELAAGIDAGRAGARGVQPSPLAGEAMVGAALGVVQRRLLESPERPELMDLAGPLMGMIVLPYLGAAAARREHARSMPRSARRNGRARPPGALLGQMSIRITHRTLVVLAAIATDGDPARPGLSNRQIADIAGVRDQGQISKLLARLQRLGLIRNTAAGAHDRGQANAWKLTPEGERLERSLRVCAPTGRPFGTCWTAKTAS